MERAAVDALEEALDRDLGAHLQALDPHQRLRDRSAMHRGEPGTSPRCGFRSPLSNVCLSRLVRAAVITVAGNAPKGCVVEGMRVRARDLRGNRTTGIMVCTPVQHFDEDALQPISGDGRELASHP